MVGFTGVLAHQGGWDEVLLVAAPIVVFVLLLRLANQRSRHLDPTLGAEPGATEPTEPTEPNSTDGGRAET